MEAVVGWTLLLGVLASLALIATGLAWHWAARGTLQFDYSLPATSVAQFVIADVQQMTETAARPRLLVNLGIAVLMLTPYVRVLASMLYFVFVERNVKYGLFTVVLATSPIASCGWVRFGALDQQGGDAALHHVERTRHGGEGRSLPWIGAPVVDAHEHGPPVQQVRDPHPAPERQCPMRAGEPARISSPFAVKRRANSWLYQDASPMRAYVLAPPAAVATPGVSTTRRRNRSTDVHLEVVVSRRRAACTGPERTRREARTPPGPHGLIGGSARGGHEPGAPWVREASGPGQPPCAFRVTFSPNASSSNESTSWRQAPEGSGRAPKSARPGMPTASRQSR
jgi:uncharacterized membrane protein